MTKAEMLKKIEQLKKKRKKELESKILERQLKSLESFGMLDEINENVELLNSKLKELELIGLNIKPHFGWGTELDKIMSITKTILFNKGEREQRLYITGLSEPTCETLISSVVERSYVDEDGNLVEDFSYDLNSLNEAFEKASIELMLPYELHKKVTSDMLESDHKKYLKYIKDKHLEEIETEKLKEKEEDSNDGEDEKPVI